VASPDTGPGADEGAEDHALVGRKRVDLASLGLRLDRASDVHRNFILSTWVLSAADAMAKRGARRSLCRQREDLLAKAALSSGTVWVLVDEVDPEVIHGWICGRRGLLQWGYLPPPLRHRGIFRSMVRAVCGKDLSYTRRPRGYKVPGYWLYDPYLLTEVG